MELQLYLLFGGNKGDVLGNFNRAADLLQRTIGRISMMSPVYQTEPWGMTGEHHFYNQALILPTTVPVRKVMQKILRIEAQLGRVRQSGMLESRTIDIDILFAEGMIISEPGLEIPHPRLHLRRFALEPLCDIAPELVHPVFNMTIKTLLLHCTDKHRVIRFDNQTSAAGTLV